MTFRIRLALAGGVAATLLGLLALHTDQGPAGATAAEPKVQDAVRVEHELVSAAIEHEHVPETLLAEVQRPRRVATRSRTRPARPDARGAMTRAQRFLLGDGRYRPEPFPRAGQ
jgi:hypothetical protein